MNEVLYKKLRLRAQAHAFFQSLPGSYQRDWAGCKSRQHWRAHGKDKKPGA